MLVWMARVALTVSLVAWPTAALAQSCALSPVFLLFRQVAGVEVTGDCKEPATVGETGDITQAMTRGLAVYRYADQVIAFTDGQSTWLYGPEGLQKRGVADKFAWEQPAPVARVDPTATPTQMPASVPATVTPQLASKLTPDLAAKCSSLSVKLVSEVPGPPPEAAAAMSRMLNQQCREIVTAHGQEGYDCYEPAARRGIQVGTNFIPGPGAAETAARGFDALVAACR